LIFIKQVAIQARHNVIRRSPAGRAWLESLLFASLPGASATVFALPTGRGNIPRDTGLSLETVSREIAKFRVLGLADVRRNTVQILDLGGLRAMMCGAGLSG